MAHTPIGAQIARNILEAEVLDHCARSTRVVGARSLVLIVITVGGDT
jgi:hypothetical protein